MFKKLDQVVERFNEVTKRLSDPLVLEDNLKFREYSKEHSFLSKIVGNYERYKKVNTEIAGNKLLLKQEKDEEMKEMVREDIEKLQKNLSEIENALKVLLLPKDENDEKNILLEIRAGAGGGEAALFAAVLFRMYSRFAERKNWKLEILSSNPTGIGGFKEIIALIEGNNVYSFLKYESGVHRVQRIPVTESGGRIHTSTVTVAVMPEAQDVEIDIKPAELKIDVYRSSGPGGQSVNTTDSAVRITHLPTNLIVCCQDEKSQHKNKAQAMKILKTRLLALKQDEQDKEIAQVRKSQVGSGDRSERIRTYNYPQGRITDHRISFSSHRFEPFLDGELDEMISNLSNARQTELLQSGQ